MICEQHLSTVLQPGPEIGDDASAEVPAEGGIGPQQVPRHGELAPARSHLEAEASAQPLVQWQHVVVLVHRKQRSHGARGVRRGVHLCGHGHAWISGRLPLCCLAGSSGDSPDRTCRFVGSASRLVQFGSGSVVLVLRFRRAADVHDELVPVGGKTVTVTRNALPCWSKAVRKTSNIVASCGMSKNRCSSSSADRAVIQSR